MSNHKSGNRSLRSHQLREPERKEIANHVRAFLANGGKIQRVTLKDSRRLRAGRALVEDEGELLDIW